MLEKNEKKPIPSLSEAFALREPNELEQRMAAARQPGYVPAGWTGWVLDSLPDSDPRKIAVKRAQINGITLSEEDIHAIFKQ
jgi:hypothetical protein